MPKEEIHHEDGSITTRIKIDSFKDMVYLTNSETGLNMVPLAARIGDIIELRYIPHKPSEKLASNSIIMKRDQVKEIDIVDHIDLTKRGAKGLKAIAYARTVKGAKQAFIEEIINNGYEGRFGKRVCGVCGKRHITKKELKEHLRTAHSY